MSTVDHLASLVPRVCRLFDPWHVPRVNSPCWRRRLHGRNLHRLDRLPNWNCGWSILGIPRCAQLSATFGLTSSYFHGKNHLLHPIDHPFYICYMDLHDLTWLIMLSHFGIDVWIKSIYIIYNIWHLMMIKHSWLFSRNIYGKTQWFATIFFLRNLQTQPRLFPWELAYIRKVSRYKGTNNILWNPNHRWVPNMFMLHVKILKQWFEQFTSTTSHNNSEISNFASYACTLFWIQHNHHCIHPKSKHTHVAVCLI